VWYTLERGSEGHELGSEGQEKKGNVESQRSHGPVKAGEERRGMWIGWVAKGSDGKVKTY